jgi:peptidoglycan/LPS O-acetylase OafA/YrhL
MKIMQTKQWRVTAPILPSSESPDRPRAPSQLDYRPDIDGLRAIAVLAVIGFHAFPAWIRGGFVGVDVFFVISGYLISTILLTDMERGSFRFSRFYIRRIRRIFPALIVVLMACMVVGWLVLFSFEYRTLGKHVAGSAAFVSNFVLWNEAGYFDKAAETKPLLHIWSLGIEEQFYIVWPLLLYLAWRFRTGTLPLLLMLFLGSFVLNVHSVDTDSAADFYSPITRFWELMAGAVLAYVSLFPAPRRTSRRLPPSAFSWLGAGGASRIMNNVNAACGLLLVVAAVLTIDGTKGYPGWWALLPVAGTYLTIAAGPNTWIGNRLLAAKFLVAIGLISYPLYLWHWPLLSLMRIANGTAPSPAAAAFAIFVSFALAWLTYFFVEKPLRLGKSAPVKAATLLVVMVAVGSAGYFTFAKRGFAFRNPGVEDLVAAPQDYEHVEGLALGNLNAPETLFIGDSTMGQYVPRVRKLVEQHLINLDRNHIVFSTSAGCPPIPDVAYDTNPGCAPFVDKMIPLFNNDIIRTVVFAAYWTEHFERTSFYLRDEEPRAVFQFSQAARERALAKFESLIFDLVKADKRVFVILETPSGIAYNPETYLPTGWRRLLGKPKSLNDPQRSDVETIHADFSSKIREVAARAGARVINPMDYLCDKQVCPVSTDGQVRYIDNYHLRASFVRDHATYIDQIFHPDADHENPNKAPYRR